MGRAVVVGRHLVRSGLPLHSGGQYGLRSGLPGARHGLPGLDRRAHLHGGRGLDLLLQQLPAGRAPRDGRQAPCPLPGPRRLHLWPRHVQACVAGAILIPHRCQHRHYHPRRPIPQGTTGLRHSWIWGATVVFQLVSNFGVIRCRPSRCLLWTAPKS